jgi:hypothetical protein
VLDLMKPVRAARDFRGVGWDAGLENVLPHGPDIAAERRKAPDGLSARIALGPLSKPKGVILNVQVQESDGE